MVGILPRLRKTSRMSFWRPTFRNSVLIAPCWWWINRGQLAEWSGTGFRQKTAEWKLPEDAIGMGITLLPEEHLAATGSTNGVIRLWDWKRGVLQREVKAHAKPVATSQ